MCSNPGYAFCCTGGAPFCASGNCDNCVVGNDIYTFNRAACTGNSFGSCRAAVGNGCCLSAGGGNTCAIVAYVGNARAGEVERVGDVGVAEVNPDQCEFSVRPNKMIYTNRNGTEQTIYIPTGAFDTAAKHVVDEDWDALDKFPAWGKFVCVMFGYKLLTSGTAGQTYTEADHILKRKRSG